MSAQSSAFSASFSSDHRRGGRGGRGGRVGRGSRGESGGRGQGGGRGFVGGSDSPFHKFVDIPMMSGEPLKAVYRTFEEVLADPQMFKSMLELEGVAIISDVASKEECAELENSWMRSIVTLTNGDQQLAE